jgi:hypothetical protein
MRSSHLAALLALAVAAPACGGEILVPVPPKPRYVDKIPQIKASKIDVLFVIDDSGSMVEEQKALSEKFAAFLRFLDPNPDTAGEDGEVDYRLAVTTVSSENAGELVGNHKIVRPGANYNPLAEFQSNVIVGIGGTAHEEGLRMAELALVKASKIIENKERQFLRPGAFLYIIFVTDEEDSSFGEPVYYQRRYVEIVGPGSQNAVKVSAVAGPSGSQACDTATPGRRYQDLVELTGGQFASICTDDWVDTLKKLAVTGIGLRKDFPLAFPPKDLDQPGFNDPTSQDILVSISYPCEKSETGEYVNQAAWEACAVEKDDQGNQFRFDQCEGKLSSELGLSCIPYHDEAHGWIYDETAHTLRFTKTVLPQAGGLVTAKYFRRDE